MADIDKYVASSPPQFKDKELNDLASWISRELRKIENAKDATIENNIKVVGSGLRIQGDFSNSTYAYRLFFQTSTVNRNTSITYIPNGTAVQSNILLETDPAVTNGNYLNIGQNTTNAFITSGIRGAGTYVKLIIQTGGATQVTIDANGNKVLGAAAIATNATNGFVYIPSCAGTPTGTPTAYTGMIPLVYDSTNNKLYAYNGAWKSTTLA